MKLAQRIAIGTIVYFLITMPATIYLVYSSVRSSLEQQISQNQYDLAVETVDKIDRFLYERQLDIISQTSRQQIINVASAKRDADVTAVERQLEEMRTVTGVWDDFAIMNSKGGIELSTFGSNAMSTRYRDSDLYKSLLKRAGEGSTVYSDLIDLRDQKEAHYGMILITPIRSADHKIVGYMEGHIAWYAVLDILKNIQGYSAYLINKDGMNIGDNTGTTKSILKDSYKDHPLFGEKEFRTGKITGSDNSSTLVAKATENGFQNYAGNGWLLVTATPTNIAFASADKVSRNLIILLTSFAILTSAAVIVIFRRIFISPINEINETAEQYAKGNFSKRVAYNKHDELGILASSFNKMATELEDVYGTLQGKVDTQTAELRSKVDEAERMNNLTIDRELKMIELKKQVKELEQKLEQKDTKAKKDEGL
ncbi:MAG: putative sensor protein [Candidatus Saccharibacteria bacterium]|nr:putative sensor protein [Candidatus Saccharibacteria bacterium]